MDTIATALQQRGLLQGAGIRPLRVIGVDEIEMLEPLVRAGYSLFDILQAHADDDEYRNISLRNYLRARYRVPLNDALRAELDAIGTHAGHLLFGRDIRQAVDEAVAGPGILRDQIARRAYELSEARGCAHGHDGDDWLQAESQLLGGA